MGRKRIYHTPEAKLAADRAKSKRYYNKAKDKINAKRRIQYRKKIEEFQKIQEAVSRQSTVEKSQRMV